MIFSSQHQHQPRSNYYAEWFPQRKREPPESKAGYTASRGLPYTRVKAYLSGVFAGREPPRLTLSLKESKPTIITHKPQNHYFSNQKAHIGFKSLIFTTFIFIHPLHSPIRQAHEKDTDLLNPQTELEKRNNNLYTNEQKSRAFEEEVKFLNPNWLNQGTLKKKLNS
ncbi:hypothetical protein YC2023_054107 [Brassica napus]